MPHPEVVASSTVAPSGTPRNNHAVLVALCKQHGEHCIIFNDTLFNYVVSLYKYKLMHYILLKAIETTFYVRP